jgi:hypothetical protein
MPIFTSDVTVEQGTNPLSVEITDSSGNPISSLSGSLNVNITGGSAVPNPLPVTGTFWQATQPVSGTFWQATQPVSIATMPTTPVTGTFWQATQPVSGTFWQATQPVSGTVAVSYPAPITASSVTSVAVSNATSTLLLAANNNRTFAVIFNGSAQNMYVKFGDGCTIASFTYFLATRTAVEINGNYQGDVTALLASGSGSAYLTELSHA